jgi:cytochrome P450
MAINPMAFMAKVARRYGGLARIPIRGNYLYLASSPDIVRELLITHRQRYVKNTRYPQIQALLGRGLLLAEAEPWRRQRLITQPHFKAEPVEAQIPWMAETARRQLDRWQSYVRSRAVLDVEPEFATLAQKLSGQSLFGASFASVGALFCNAASAVKQCWPKAPTSVWGVLIPARRHMLPAFDNSLAALDQCVYKILAERRATDFQDCGMLQHLARSNRMEGQPFTERELRDQLLTLFFAGYETSATALCWIHYLLAQNTDVYLRLMAEVDAVLDGRVPTAESLNQLQYTAQVVQESLRLYSPIHSISRVALEENTLGAYRIPAGASVCVSVHAMHRLAEFWPDPEQFDPTRFDPDKCEVRHRFSYLPFAAGHRNCIGAGQAIVELKLIVALIAQRYRLRLVPGQRIEPAPGTTMYPRFGMKVMVDAKAGPT